MRFRGRFPTYSKIDSRRNPLRIILKVEDSLEVSLKLLDEKEESISKILEIDLFYDSPQIRQVVKDIRASRDSILQVAGQIASIEESFDEEKNS